jgi:hypothetical protein
MRHSVKSSALLFFSVISFSLLVEACAFIERDVELNPWVGSHKSYLIASWGAPAKTTVDGKGGAILIYEGEYIRVYIEKAEIYGNVYYFYYARFGGIYYVREIDHSYRRQTRFYVDEKGYIYKWETRG